MAHRPPQPVSAVKCPPQLEHLASRRPAAISCVLTRNVERNSSPPSNRGDPSRFYPEGRYYLVEQFSWPRFLSIQLWLMVLFLIYVTIHELNMLFGDGELYRLFFRWRSSEAKLTRRWRVRLLIRLNRLTEANPIEAISERGSPAYAELVDILRELASPPVAPAARA
jgi:hypothetical protein